MAGVCSPVFFHYLDHLGIPETAPPPKKRVLNQALSNADTELSCIRAELKVTEGAQSDKQEEDERSFISQKSRKTMF